MQSTRLTQKSGASVQERAASRKHAHTHTHTEEREREEGEGRGEADGRHTRNEFEKPCTYYLDIDK